MEEGEIVYASNNSEKCEEKEKMVYISDVGGENPYACVDLVDLEESTGYKVKLYKYITPVTNYNELFFIGELEQRRQLLLHENEKWGWDDMNVDKELFPSLRLQIQKLLNPDNKNERVKIAAHIANYAHMIIYNLTKENL